MRKEISNTIEGLPPPFAARHPIYPEQPAEARFRDCIFMLQST
jgi:hypothetical protein